MKTYRLLLALFAWLAFVALAPAQNLRIAKPFEYTLSLKQQADRGDAESQYRIGYCYYFGKRGGPLCSNVQVDQDYSIAFNYFTKASSQNHAEATGWLGSFYRDGIVVDIDNVKAFQLAERAMKLGSVVACIDVAYYYHHGLGVKKDLNRAIELYNKLVDLGVPQAMCNLAVIYRSEVVYYNPKKALELMKRSADKGFAIALNNLGEWYYDGIIVESNYNDATRFFYKSLLNGYADARVGLSKCYQKGALGASNYKTLDQWILSLNSQSSRPILSWNSALSTTSANYSLLVGVKSSSKVTDVKVFLNGQLSRGVNAVPNDGNDFIINRSIVLSDGNNSIEVEVTNASGSSTLTKNVVYTKKSTPSPTPINNVAQKSQKRLALVIGNAEYVKATKLQNPYNDAKDIAAKLRQLGFEVIEKHDMTTQSFKEAIRTFGTKAAEYDVSLFYYAGHALENDGKNYLIPVDAELRTLADVEYECVRADYVLAHLEQAKSKMNIIVLDACRNNPISRSWSRSISRGLSSMDPPSGTFIAFSTSPGHTADDGKGRNSPFTGAFLHSLDKPNLPLELFFKEVIQEVRKNTSNVQTPWNQSSFYGDFIFNVK